MVGTRESKRKRVHQIGKRNGGRERERERERERRGRERGETQGREWEKAREIQ